MIIITAVEEGEDHDNKSNHDYVNLRDEKDWEDI